MRKYDLPTSAHRRRYLAAALMVLSSVALAAPPAATPVFVTKAEIQAIEDRIEALGTLRANESVELTASVTEIVTAISFDDGDRVKAGQVLLEMTSGEEHAQLEEALVTVDEAKRQYQRIKSLRAQQSASESQLDEQRRIWEASRARLNAIESRLADRLIRAPFGGVVGLRNVSVGALVTPGDLITTLDDDSVMKLDFPVPAVYLGIIRTDMPVKAITRTWQGRVFEGSVKSIDSRVDPVTRTVIVRALLSNSDHALRPGMLMSVELFSAQRRAIVLPEECLVAQGQEHFVFVVSADDNMVQRRQVRIGTRRPGQVEIIEGLTVGELVITDGTLKVRPGSQVSIRAVDDGTTRLHQLLEQPESTSQP
ncbi:MAG: efflux RND transporter periplasmic adaptor subunit [Gammaproteobacteria bacterium]|nr:efflux RND transporter periplasmic adaptor subunit [Gammaproteobacteria bacterium]